MKRFILTLIVSIFLVSQAYALDITLTIQTSDVERVKAGFFQTYPKQEGYTDIQWFKEVIRRFVVMKARQGEEELTMENAVDGLAKDMNSKIQ